MSKFESHTCSRCGGSGNFSFNLKDGTVCYGCNGTGVKLTKRGQVAHRFFEESLSLPASELKVGMRIKESALSKKFALIQDVHYGTDKELGKEFNTPYLLGPNGDKQMVLLNTDNGTIKFYPESRVKILYTDEEKQYKLTKAIEYQSTLNKNGTLKKPKAKL